MPELPRQPLARERRQLDREQQVHAHDAPRDPQRVPRRSERHEHVADDRSDVYESSMIAATCTPTKIVARPPRNRWRSVVHTGGAFKRPDRGGEEQARARRSRRGGPRRRSHRPGRRPTRADWSRRRPRRPSARASVRTAQPRLVSTPSGSTTSAAAPRSLTSSMPSLGVEEHGLRRAPRPASRRPRRRSRRARVCGRSSRCRDRAGGAAPLRRRAPTAGRSRELVATAPSTEPEAGDRLGATPGVVDRDRATPHRRARRRAPGDHRRRSPTRPTRRAP